MRDVVSPMRGLLSISSAEFADGSAVGLRAREQSTARTTFRMSASIQLTLLAVHAALDPIAGVASCGDSDETSVDVRHRARYHAGGRTGGCARNQGRDRDFGMDRLRSTHAREGSRYF